MSLRKPLWLGTCCFRELNSPHLALFLFTYWRLHHPQIPASVSSLLRAGPALEGMRSGSSFDFSVFYFNDPQFIINTYLVSVFPTRIKSLWFGAFSDCSPLHFQCSAQLLAISKPSINIWWNEYKNKSPYPLDWNSTWQISLLCTKHESALKEYVRRGNW